MPNLEVLEQIQLQKLNHFFCDIAVSRVQTSLTFKNWLVFLGYFENMIYGYDKKARALFSKRVPLEPRNESREFS